MIHCNLKKNQKQSLVFTESYFFASTFVKAAKGFMIFKNEKRKKSM